MGKYGMHPCGQKTPGLSGPVVRPKKNVGAASTLTGVSSLLRTLGDASGGLGATWTQQDADFLRTPSVDLGKYGDASMGTEDPSLVRACGEA